MGHESDVGVAPKIAGPGLTRLGAGRTSVSPAPAWDTFGCFSFLRRRSAPAGVSKRFRMRMRVKDPAPKSPEGGCACA